MQVRFVLTTIVLSALLASCSYTYDSQLKLVSNSVPLTFTIESDQKVQWIWIQGPLQNKREPAPRIPEPDDPEKVIIWRIEPEVRGDIRPFVPANTIPPITYGQVPKGWEQVKPQSGAPPALLDGYVYYIGVVPGPDLCVFVKNGRIEPYQEQDPGPPCGTKK